MEMQLSPTVGVSNFALLQKHSSFSNRALTGPFGSSKSTRSRWSLAKQHVTWSAAFGFQLLLLLSKLSVCQMLNGA